MPTILREANLFILVGVTATACHVGATLGAQKLLELGPLEASLIGYLCSVSISYFGNAVLTFRRPVLHGPQFMRFMAISLTGLGINLSTVFVATHLMHWPLKLAMIPVVLLVPPSTFLMSKIWAFRDPLAAP